MSMDARISTRIDPALKAKGDAILAELGLKPSQYVSLAYAQLVAERGVPFKIKAPEQSKKDMIDAKISARERAGFDISPYIGIAKGMFGSVEEIDAYIRKGRDEWDR